MTALESMGSESTKRILMKHGAKEPFFGVKVGDMKTIVKQVKKDHALSLALYNTGNSDAMYLAGLIADEQKISREELQTWVKTAPWYMISEYTVAWIAAESPYGWSLGLEWIESPEDHIAAAGWSTLSGWVSLRPDEQLDIPVLEGLLDRVMANIHQAPNRSRYTMNGFVIVCGGSVKPLFEKALSVAEQIGKVRVDLGGTACKVPEASSYIQKIETMGRLGKKKKMLRC